MRCLVADDDPLVCETVESYLSRVEGVTFSVSAGDGMTALNLLSTGDFDAVFLDLEMPGLDGESLLRSMPRQMPVVVISASSEFGARSYEFNVTDYLVKPIAFPRFYKAVGKVRERLHTLGGGASARPADGLFVKDGTRIVKIDLPRLLFVRAESSYVAFVGEEQSVMSLMSMKRLEEILPAEDFIRIHRSYLVNRSRISRVEDGQVIIGTHSLPVGESYRDELMRRLRVAR